MTTKEAKKNRLKNLVMKYKKNDPEDKKEKFSNLKSFMKEEKSEGEKY